MGYSMYFLNQAGQ